MQRLSTFFTLLLLGTTLCWAQHEDPILVIDNQGEIRTGYQAFDGFILDVNKVFKPEFSIPTYSLDYLKPDPYINLVEKMGLKYNKVQYGNYQPTIYGSTTSRYYSGWGYSTNAPLNTATFQINDNLKISTSGDYDADGYKRRNPAALPWEKNDFRGAFELKSSNGVSFRLEVQRRSTPAGFW